jgi:hypothetical protein
VPNGGYAFTRVPGGWAITTLLAGWTCPPHCWNPACFVVDGSTHATRIGIGLALDAAARPGEVWLLSYARNIVNTAKASATIRLFSTTGRALGPHYSLPAGYLLVRGIGRYLLLTQGPPPNTSNSDLNSAAVLWDPRPGRIVDRFPCVIDAGPDEIAVSPRCHGCHLMLLNVLTGRSVTTPIPAGPTTGGFTDDGALLVTRLPSAQLAVYNTGSRALTVIPGTALDNSDWQTFGWLNGSHTPVIAAGSGRDFTTGPPGPDQLAYWQPGDTQLRIATVTDPDEISALQSWAF